MSASFGATFDTGKGVIFEFLDGDLSADVVLYEDLYDTVAKPREVKRASLSRGMIQSRLLPALEPTADFGVITDLGMGLTVEKTSSDGDVCFTFYEFLATTGGAGQPAVLKQFTLTEAQVASLLEAIKVELDFELWAYWPLEDLNVEDATPNGRDLTVSPSDNIDIVAAKVDNGVLANDDDFEGYVSYTLPASAYIDLDETDFTFAFWHKTTGALDTASFFFLPPTLSPGFLVNTIYIGFNFQGQGCVSFGVQVDSSPYESALIPIDTTSFHFYVLRWNKETRVAQLSIDGGPFAYSSVVAPAGAQPMYISDIQFPWRDDQLVTLSGEHTFDEPGVWLRQLSEAEAVELYNEGDGATYPF